MKIFYSELCLLGKNPIENVDRMVSAGAENVEVMLDGPGWDRFDIRMDPLAGELKKRDVAYSVHTPVWDANLTSENFFIREGVYRSLCQSIVFASKINAAHVVIHPGFCQYGAFSKDTAKKRSAEYLSRLVEFNRNYGARLLIENVGDPAHAVFTYEEYVHFLDPFPKEVGYLVDLGHAHFNRWNLADLLGAVGDRLYAVHIHDNDGRHDQHRPIGEGTIDWDSVFSKIRKIGRNSLNLVLEYNTGIPVEKLAEGRDILKNCAADDFAGKGERGSGLS